MKTHPTLGGCCLGLRLAGGGRYQLLSLHNRFEDVECGFTGLAIIHDSRASFAGTHNPVVDPDRIIPAEEVAGVRPGDALDGAMIRYWLSQHSQFLPPIVRVIFSEPAGD